MDLTIAQYSSGLFWSLAIAMYGGFEYHRREQNHKMTLLALRYGKEPPESPQKPQLWRLVTTTTVCLVLFVASFGLLAQSRQIIYGAYAMYILAGLFFAVGLALAFVLAGDLKAYRNRHIPRKE